MTSPTRGSSSKTRLAAPAVPAPSAGAATVVAPGTSRRCRWGSSTLVALWATRDRLGRPADPSPLDAARDTAHGSSRPRGVSGHFTRRQVGGVHRRRWTANDSSSCSSWLAGRRCRSRAIQSITSTRAGRPTRARSSIFPRRHRENSRGASGRFPPLGGVPRRVVNSVGGADISPTNGRLAFFRLAKEGIQLVTALNRRFHVRRGRHCRGGHVLPVSPLVAGRQMDCLSAGRQRQVRRVRGAGLWRRSTAPVDA